MTKQEKKEKLEKLGYSVNAPYGANYLTISGMMNGNKTKYFNAKKSKAASIVSTLIKQGFEVKAEKDNDGIFDFYIR